MEIINGTFPVYYPNEECMCPEDLPVSSQDNPDGHAYCFDLRNVPRLRTDAALPDDTRFFSSQYVTDGQVRICKCWEE